MAHPASTVRFVKSRNDRNGCGASLLLISQRGNKTRQTQPMTSMAMMLALCHSCFAFCAKVKGISIKDTAAESRSRPMISSSYQRFSAAPTNVWPFRGETGRRRSFAAFLMFENSASARGKKATGSTIVQMP